jgi:Uma2 family endonuclease
MSTITFDEWTTLDSGVALRIPMSFDAFMELEDGIHAEWTDGVAIVTPAPSRYHQYVVANVAFLLREALPGLVVLPEAGVETRPRHERRPDVSAVVRLDGESFFTAQTPVLVVEVLSRSTRVEDTVRKAEEYRRAGIGQYWIVDGKARTLIVLGNAGSGWETLALLDDATPTAEVVVGDHGTVEIDLAHILD